jgi:hypothetical protein
MIFGLSVSRTMGARCKGHLGACGSSHHVEFTLTTGLREVAPSSPGSRTCYDVGWRICSSGRPHGRNATGRRRNRSLDLCAVPKREVGRGGGSTMLQRACAVYAQLQSRTYCPLTLSINAHVPMTNIYPSSSSNAQVILLGMLCMLKAASTRGSKGTKQPIHAW